MKPLAILFGVILLAACQESGEKKVNKTVINKSAVDNNTNDWIFDKVSGTILKFKNGKQFNTNLYELKYIGQVTNGNKAPFLIFSGRDCDECDASISIYIHSPSNGVLEVEAGKNRYQYPGTERDYANDSLLSKSRAFYGTVLPGFKGIVWYQDELMGNNTWQKSMFLVHLNEGVKTETHTHGADKLNQTLQLLGQDSCKEIKGLNYKSEP